jgi:anti-sigma factor RsiW
MCDFSERLVAWMDSELAANEAAAVAQHVQACQHCQERGAAYEEVSREFAAYYEATTQTALASKPHRKLPRWVPLAAATAAAAVIVLLALLPRSAKQVPVVPQVAVTHLPVAAEPAIKPITPVRRAHAASHRRAPSENWAMTEPAIQIAIPADAMFPPGAVPEGATYVANLSLADGSVQAIRLQP